MPPDARLEEINMMKSKTRLRHAASSAVRAMTDSLESRILFAEVAGTLLVDVNATNLTLGNSAVDVPNNGTLGGVFESGGATAPVIGYPDATGTAGTVGIRLDGTQYLRLLESAGGATIGAPASISGSDTVSIEAWVWNPGLASEETVLAWGQRGGPDGTNMSFNYGSNTAYGAVGHWGNPDLGWTATPPVAGHWHHLVYTYDGSVDTVYADGVQVNQETVGALGIFPGTPINLGSQNEGDGVTATGGLRGSLTIGRVRIHDGVLTPAQIQANYDAEKAEFVEPTVPTTPPPPLVKLVDVDPTTLPDGSTADNLVNTGTLGGKFAATGGNAPVIDQPAQDATGGTVGIKLDGTQYLQSVDAGGALLPAPSSLTGVDPKSSVEVWAWNPGLDNEETMLSWGHRGGPDGSNYSFNYGNNNDYGAMGHWGGQDIGWGPTPPAGGHWHHLVYTFDGTTQRVYIDGAQTNSEVLGPGALNIFAGQPISLGTQIEGDGVTPTPGLRGSLTLGRVRVYSGILTPEQVATDYNTEKATYVEPTLPPPPAAVKLVDVDATNLPAGTANDIPNTGQLGGFFNATGGGDTVPVIGQPLTSSTTGTKGIRLDGNDYLQLVSTAGDPSSVQFAPGSIVGVNPTYSVETWAFNPGIANEEAMVSWGRRGDPAGSNMSFNYGSNPDYGAVGHWGAQDIGWGPTVPAAQQWHHLVYTYDGNNSRVYVDGALVNQEALGPGAINTVPGTPINIGTQIEPDGVTPTNLLRGSLTLGKVRIYSGVLTDAEISTNYNAEKTTFVSPNSAPPTNLTSGPTHRYTFNNTAGAAPSGAVVPDTIGGASFDATVLGAGATFTGGRLALPGGPSSAAAYVDLPNGILSSNGVAKGGSGQVTLEGWVRQTGSQAWSRIYDIGSSTAGEVTGPGGTGNGADFVMLTAQTGDLPVHRFETNDAGNPGSRWDEVTHPFDQQLLHFAFTWDETAHVAKYYENGVETGSLPSGVLISDIDDVNAWLGRSQFLADANFQGEYDEFRVYNRVLSGGEIAGDFQAGPDVINTAGAPTLSSTTIDDGTAQRSQVKKLTLTFDRAVTLAAGAAKLQLLNSGGSGANDNSPPTDISAAMLAPTSPDGGKTWVYTFDPNSTFVQHTGGGASTGSLADGIYTLSVDPTKVTAGGIAMTTAPAPLTFHRLFGDINGNKTVNLQDYGQFRNAFGKSTGQAGFDPAFDFDNNGTINTADYGQFRLRFSKLFTY